MLSAAREMRITSPAGTDITYRLGQYPVITQYGYTDQPGRWDNLPGGFLYTGGCDGEIDGVVVLDTGDIVFPFKRYLSGPIRMIVEKGVVTRIEGNHVDAELLRSFMARWNDPRAYAGLAALYVASGEPQAAVTTLRALVERNQASPMAWVQAVKTLRVLGDPTGASRLLARARTLHPNHPEIEALAG